MKEGRWMLQRVVYERVNYSLPREEWICNKPILIFNIYERRYEKDIRFLQRA
jgi:hypothetical protein